MRGGSGVWGLGFGGEEEWVEGGWGAGDSAGGMASGGGNPV